MTTPTDLLPLMSYCMVMSGTPGPNNIMLTASGANFGYRRTLPQILGINIGGFVQTFLTCLGLGALFTAYPTLQAALRVVGAAYLIYLAWKLTGGAIGEAQSPGSPVSFTEGAFFQAVNPKSWIKAITIATVFMPAGLSAPAGAFLVAAIGLLIGFPCISAWALFGVAIRGFLKDARKQRFFNLAMAGVLLGLAVLSVA